MCIVRIKETVDRTCDTVDLAESSDTEKSDTDTEKWRRKDRICFNRRRICSWILEPNGCNHGKYSDVYGIYKNKT